MILDFHLADHVHAHGMTTAFKGSGQEDIRQLKGHFGGDDAAAHAEDIGVVMQTGILGFVMIVDGGGADTGDLVGCHADTDAADILCTAHDDGTWYLSIVNRYSKPLDIDTDGYEILSCTELRTHEYSFESNQFSVIKHADMTVWGHSVLFLVLKPNKGIHP